MYKKTILKNGLRIITVPMKDNPTVTVFVLVEAGSKYETKKNNGISHFLEHMCFKGTVKRPSNSDISSELDSLGASYNAFTSQEYTGYYAKVEYTQIDNILDIISDMYLNPLLPTVEIEKEKGVIIEEINMYEDLPQRKVHEVFYSLVYGDQPVGWSVLGPKENINHLTREDFINYRDRFYTPEATTVVVAGNFNEEKIITAITKIFSTMLKNKKGSKVSVIEDQIKPRISLHQKETDQTHLVLGLRTFNHYDNKVKVMRLLMGILDAGMSSRLFKKLRDEMGVCYYVQASHDTFTDHGLFSISAGVDNKKVKEVIRVVLAELKKLKTELVSEAELQKVKQNLIGSLSLGLETSDSLAQFYGGQEIMHDNIIITPKQLIEEINSINSQQIKDLAEEIFIDKNLNLAIVGRFTDPDEFTDLFKF